MKIKITSGLLIAAGILLLLYPRATAWYYDNQQQKLVEEWQEAFATVQVSYEQADDAAAAVQPESLQTEISMEEEPEPNRDAVQLDLNMEGMLYIDKIELKLPILTGATEENLNTSAASIADTGMPGEAGNYAIAGHRNRDFGRNFNRLDELVEGDFIDVDTGEQLYRYTVTDKLYVEPHEVWVLDAEGSEKEITLVTCHPIDTGTHRLIVKGKLIDT